MNLKQGEWFLIWLQYFSFYLKIDGMQEALISNQETQEMSSVKLFHCWKISINFQAT